MRFLLARSALHELLIQILRDHAAFISRRNANDAAPGRIERAIDWMKLHVTENFLIEDVAEQVGLGVARFHQLFVDATGLTPNAFRMRQRVSQAKHMLRSTEIPVTTLAIDLGFSSSQYFATVFKSLTGLTPIQYRHPAPRHARA